MRVNEPSVQKHIENNALHVLFEPEEYLYIVKS